MSTYRFYLSKEMDSMPKEELVVTVISTVLATQGQSLEFDTQRQIALALHAEREARERDEQARVAQAAEAQLRERVRFERARMAWERVELIEHMQVDHGLDLVTMEEISGPLREIPMSQSCYANGMLICDCEFPCYGGYGYGHGGQHLPQLAQPPSQQQAPRIRGHGHPHPRAHGNGYGHGLPMAPPPARTADSQVQQLVGGPLPMQRVPAWPPMPQQQQASAWAPVPSQQQQQRANASVAQRASGAVFRRPRPCLDSDAVKDSSPAAAAGTTEHEHTLGMAAANPVTDSHF